MDTCLFLLSLSASLALQRLLPRPDGPAQQVDQVAVDQVAYEQLVAKCAAERKGRISAEIAHRTLLKSQHAASPASSPRHSKDALHLLPVGYVTSPFLKRTGCPRQPCLCPSALGQIVLEPAVSGEALAGLEGFG
jgi:hypothetical protein